VERTETAFPLAANPELIVARRYAAATAKLAEVTFLATNPELMLTRRYAAAPKSRAKVSFLVDNPELRAARRYGAEMAKTAGAAFQAANPEIQVCRRHATEMTNLADAEFLTWNPEIRILRLYTAESAEPQMDAPDRGLPLTCPEQSNSPPRSVCLAGCYAVCIVATIPTLARHLGLKCQRSALKSRLAWTLQHPLSENAKAFTQHGQ
jgi:hypothetical protein